MFDINKLKKRVYTGIIDFGMICDGDKVIAAISGGKDSLAMLDMLVAIQKSKKINFTIVPVYVVPKIPGIIVLSSQLIDTFKSYGLEYIIQELSIPKGSKLEKGIQEAATCQWCSYTRRIALFKVAKRIGATKIAYGHHMDDIVDTIFMNIAHGRNMETMPPINKIRKGDFSIIRPMVYLREKDIIQYCKERGITPLYADCIVSKNSDREKIRDVVDHVEGSIPDFVENMFIAYKSKVGF